MNIKIEGLKEDVKDVLIQNALFIIFSTLEQVDALAVVYGRNARHRDEFGYMEDAKEDMEEIS